LESEEGGEGKVLLEKRSRLSNHSESSGRSLQSGSSNGSSQTLPEDPTGTANPAQQLKEKYIDDRLANFNPKARPSKEKALNSFSSSASSSSSLEAKESSSIAIATATAVVAPLTNVTPAVEEKDDLSCGTHQDTHLADNAATVKETAPPLASPPALPAYQSRKVLSSAKDLMPPPPALASHPSKTLAGDDEVAISTKLRVVKRETSTKLPQQINSPFANAFQEIQVNRRPYLQLDGVLGKGASSSVCRVIALHTNTGGPIPLDLNESSQSLVPESGNGSGGVEIFAYKRIEIRNSLPEDTEEVFASYANEINLLKQCRGCPFIIKLIDSEVNRKDLYVSMVLELGEVDLATAINHYKKTPGTGTATGTDNLTLPSSKVNPFFMRMVWERMLLAVDYIHNQRIVHGDLKPANFVFVRGQLKLIDFGISKQISNDTTNIVRSGLIGTINYMAPEAVMPHSLPTDNEEEEEEEEDDDEGGRSKKSPRRAHEIKHGRASDVWSLGCILYQMLYGKTPFATIRNIQQKLALITNPKAEIQFPILTEYLGVDVAKKCLIREISQRATIRGPEGLLNHPFLTSHSMNKTNQGTNTEISYIDSGEPMIHSQPRESICGQSIEQERDVSKAPMSRVEVRSIVASVVAHLKEIKDGSGLEKEALCEEVTPSLTLLPHSFLFLG
jgi:serine/threonine-protein kinase TTK/MPS1